MKKEYQNILDNLDEAIVWQKQDSLQYFNTNSLKIWREISLNLSHGDELMTKLKAFYTE